MNDEADGSPTRRSLAKQRTRERVLAAARAQFGEHGYEGATIRDIASAAGMSTGAVFASFSDKSDLFEAVVMEDIATISDSMSQAAAATDNVDDALEAVFRAAIERHLTQLPILKSSLSMSWVRDAPSLKRAGKAFSSMRSKVAEVLEVGVRRGQLSQNTDIALISQILWDVYLAELRRVVFFSKSAEDIPAHQRRQAEVILKGYRGAA